MLKELINWIRLFFWLRKEKESVVKAWNYSSEFADVLRGSVGYESFATNDTLWKLWGLTLEGIEVYHRWNNENRAKMYHLQLDILSPQIQKKVERYDDEPVNYWVFNHSHSPEVPDRIVAGPYGQELTARAKIHELEQQPYNFFTYYYIPFPQGKRPFELPLPE